MRTINRFILLCLFIGLSLLIFTGFVWSQGNYGLNWWSVDGGGATIATDSGFILSGSTGQVDAISTIVSTNGNFQLGSGFWYGAIDSSTQPFPILLVAQSGYTNIQLNWNATNDPDVVNYRISRAISGTVELLPIATTPNLRYFDTDPILISGTDYCYQVEALYEDETVVLLSNLSCAPYGQLELWVPEVWAEPGTTAIVPINIHNAYELGIGLAEIWLEYDAAVIEPISVTNTALTAGYEWEYLVVPNGASSQVRMFTDGGVSPPVMYGEGALIWLYVNIIGPENSNTPLNLLEYIEGIGGTVIYVPEDLSNSVPLTLADGILYAEPFGPYRLGDLNGDGVVQAVDALIALRIANGVIIPTPEQQSAGDVNGDGVIGAADASMILYYAVHGYWPPLESLLTSKQGEASPVIASLNHVEGEPGSTVEVTLNLGTVTNWAGAEFVVAYPQELVAYINDVTVEDGIAEAFNVEFHDAGNGLLYIAMADGLPVTGSGAVITISLTLTSNASAGSIGTLALADARLNDINGRDFATTLQQPVERVNGSIRVGGQMVYLPVIIR